MYIYLYDRMSLVWARRGNVLPMKWSRSLTKSAAYISRRGLIEDKLQLLSTVSLMLLLQSF